MPLRPSPPCGTRASPTDLPRPLPAKCPRLPHADRLAVAPAASGHPGEASLRPRGPCEAGAAASSGSPPPGVLSPADSGTPREAAETAHRHRRRAPSRPAAAAECPRAAPSGTPAAPAGPRRAEGRRQQASTHPRSRPPSRLAFPSARQSRRGSLTRSLRGRQGRRQLPHGGGPPRRPPPSRRADTSTKMAAAGGAPARERRGGAGPARRPARSGRGRGGAGREQRPPSGPGRPGRGVPRAGSRSVAVLKGRWGERPLPSATWTSRLLLQVSPSLPLQRKSHTHVRGEGGPALEPGGPERLGRLRPCGCPGAVWSSPEQPAGDGRTLLAAFPLSPGPPLRSLARCPAVTTGRLDGDETGPQLQVLTAPGTEAAGFHTPDHSENRLSRLLQPGRCLVFFLFLFKDTTLLGKGSRVGHFVVLPETAAI